MTNGVMLPSPIMRPDDGGRIAAIEGRVDDFHQLWSGALPPAVEMRRQFTADLAGETLDVGNQPGKGQVPQQLADGPLQRVAHRVDADGHAAGGAARGGGGELDLLVHADRREHVARDRVQEGAVEIAVRKVGDLRCESSLDVDPQIALMQIARPARDAVAVDRTADVPFVQLDTLHGVGPRGGQSRAWK